MSRFIAVLFVMMVLVMPSKASGQCESWQAKSLTVLSGEGVLNKGFGADMFFKNCTKPNQELEFYADDGQGWFAYEWISQSPIGEIKSAATGGLLYNTWWFGPRIIWKPVNGLTLMTWPGASIGEKFGNPGWDLNLGIKSGFAYLDAGPFTFSYVIMKYEENDVQYIPGVSLTRRLTGEYKILFGGDYDMTNDHPMFRVAVTWEPKMK